MKCPHCDGWSADCEDLPREQEVWRPIRCGSCEKIYAISWEVSHFASKLEDLNFFTTGQSEFLKEVAEA